MGSFHRPIAVTGISPRLREGHRPGRRCQVAVTAPERTPSVAESHVRVADALAQRLPVDLRCPGFSSVKIKALVQMDQDQIFEKDHH